MSKILCNKCGAEFDVTLYERKDGDLDITYIQCPHCDEEYLVSVTDGVLRNAVEECRCLFEKAQAVADTDTSEKLMEAARQMKDNNSKRCFELMAEYRNDKENEK